MLSKKLNNINISLSDKLFVIVYEGFTKNLDLFFYSQSICFLTIYNTEFG